MILSARTDDASPTFRWVEGKFDDNWIATNAHIEVETPSQLTIEAYLPENDSTSDRKDLAVVIDGLPHDIVSLKRGKVDTIRLSLAGPGTSRITLTCPAELTETDVRKLGFTLLSISTTPLAANAEAASVASVVSTEKDIAVDVAIAEDARTRYCVFPDYRKTNPYQKLVENALAEMFAVTYGAIDVALDDAVALADMGGDPGVFHLHWTNTITGSAKNAADFRLKAQDFLSKLDLFQALGGTVVWTIHNVIPHDAKHYDAECAFMTELGRRADIIHLHSLRSLPEVEAHFKLPHDRIVEIPHPSYRGVYPDYISPASARRALGLDPDVMTFMFIGQLRPYRGIDALIDAVETLIVRGERVQLLVAGKPIHPYDAEMIRKMVERVPGAVCLPEFIPDADLQIYYAAADVAVFPYRNVLTSGSVLGALSFGTPIIAPSFGAISDVVRNGETGWTYDPGSESLVSIMQSAIKNRGSLNKMRDNCLALADSLTWTNFAESLAAAVQSEKADRTRIVEINGKHRSLKVVTPAPTAGRVESVAIVVLCYRNIEDLHILFGSLERMDDLDFRVYLIDNASKNINCQELRALALVYNFPISIHRTTENLGYAGGNNVGIALARDRGHPFVWVLNPDIEVEPECLSHLKTFAEKTAEAKVIGSVILKDRRTRKVWSAGGRVRFEGGVDTGHLYGGMDAAAVPSEPYRVEYITGASLFVRSEVFEKVGLIPEDYFLYFEETDWCLSVRAALGEVLYICPEARLVHNKTSEKGGLPSQYYFYYFVRNAINFTRKFAPAHLDQTIQRVRESFIQPWLDKIKTNSSANFDIYDRIAKAALADGVNAVVGRRLNFAKPRSRFGPDMTRVVITSVTSDVLSGWIEPAPSLSSKQKALLLVDDYKTIDVMVDMSRRPDPTAVAHADKLEKVRRSKDMAHLRVPEEKEQATAFSSESRRFFDISIPNSLKDGALHEIRFVNEAEVASVPVSYVALAPFRFSGRIDGFSDYEIRGWACNISRPGLPVEFSILCDGEVVVTGLADRHRPDLEDAQIGNGRHGFSLRVPLSFLDGQKRTFVLVNAATGEVIHQRDLQGQPPVPAIGNGSLIEKERWLYYAREVRYDPNDALIRFYLDASRISGGDLLMDGPLVSIVMPAFNREDTIGDSIASVLKQTYEHFELIVIDDGSMDGTVAAVRTIIEETGDLRVRLVTLDRNRGVSAARNAGLSVAAGDYVAYLDSDNVWRSEYLHGMLTHILLSSAQNAYCAQRVFQMINGPDGPNPEPVSIRGGEFDLAQLENRNYIDLNCFMHTRALTERLGGFNEKMTRLVDWELIMRYCRDSRPVYVPALLSDYFMGKASNQITRVETHADNLALLNRTQRTEVTDTTMRAPHCKKLDLVILLFGGGPHLATLRERVTLSPEIARVVVLAVGKEGVSALDELPEALRATFQIRKAEGWHEVAGVVSQIASKEAGAAPFISFVTASVTVQDLTFHRLMAVFEQFRLTRIAAAVGMVRVTDSIRKRHRYVQGPNLFPKEPRPFRAASAPGTQHCYLSDRLPSNCFVIRSEFIAALAPQLVFASTWSEFCDALHEVSSKTEGFTVIDQTAKVML